MQMKKMIKMALMTAAMFAMVATVAKAQGGGGGGGAGRGAGRGGNPTAALFKDITLTDTQKAKSDSIVAFYAEKQTEIRASANGDMASVQPKMTENTKLRTEALKSILTDEQKKVFDANVAAMPAGRGRPPVSL
jgi:Spy/CpxP family protein refolding chaperone